MKRTEGERAGGMGRGGGQTLRMITRVDVSATFEGGLGQALGAKLIRRRVREDERVCAEVVGRRKGWVRGRTAASRTCREQEQGESQSTRLSVKGAGRV